MKSTKLTDHQGKIQSNEMNAGGKGKIIVSQSVLRNFKFAKCFV